MPPAPKLSGDEQTVLDYLAREYAARGEFPSVTDLCDALGDDFCDRLPNIMTSLGAKGILKRYGDELLLPWLGPRQRVRFAVHGSIPAGMADPLAPDTTNTVKIDLNAIGIPTSTGTFLLRVRGDSMSGTGIEDGDTVIVDKRRAKIGDIVAALIDQETTLKRLVEKNGRRYLQAENLSYRDLVPAEELIVQGVVIGHIRPLR